MINESMFVIEVKGHSLHRRQVIDTSEVGFPNTVKVTHAAQADHKCHKQATVNHKLYHCYHSYFQSVA